MSIEKENKAKGKANLGAVIILIISAVVFIPTGGAAVLQSLRGQNPSFGTVNGQKIKYEPGTKFYQAASNIASRYKAIYKEIDDKKYEEIIKTAYGQTVTDIYYSDAVAASGYEVPAEAVNRDLVSYFTINGSFDKKLYSQQSATKISGIKKELEERIISQRFIDDNFGTRTLFNRKSVYGLKASAAEKVFLGDMGKLKHSFSVAAFNKNEYPKEEIVTYARDNASKFVKYDLKAITLSERKAADELLTQLRSGEITFEDALAKSTGHYADDTGAFSASYRFQIDRLLDEGENTDTVLSLKNEEYSEPVEISFAGRSLYAIFKGNGDAVQPDFESEALLDTVKGYIEGYESSVIETYFLNQAKDFIDEVSVTNFDTACRKFNITAENTEPFGLNYANTSFSDRPSGVLASAAYDKDVLTKLFALKEKEVSEPFVLGQKVVVARCTKIAEQEKEPAESEEAAIEEKEAAEEAVLSKITTADENTMYSYLVKKGAYSDTFNSAYDQVFKPVTDSMSSK